MRTGRPSNAQIDDPDCWQHLANEIITQAAYDYRHAVKALRRNPGDTLNGRLKTDVEKFLCSRWFTVLSEADGEYILRRLEEEAASGEPVKFERKTRKAKKTNTAVEDDT